MASLVDEHPELELVTPPSLSICCFRYRPPDASDDERLDRLNERIMTEVQVGGRAYLSNAILRDRFVLRACIVNFRTEAGDVRALLEEVVSVGRRLAEQAPARVPEQARG
jgi:glutamate/tyrosine decarboxylase-like PLP-dependent enzyme